jgi:hypothetical protein
MVQLVLVYCLLSNGASCVERRPLLEDSPSLMSCMTEAQPIAAQFLTEHPTYRLASWRCEIGKREERRA